MYTPSLSQVTQRDDLCYWYLDFCVDHQFHTPDNRVISALGEQYILLHLPSFESPFVSNEFKFVWLSHRILVLSTLSWQMTKVIKECGRGHNYMVSRLKDTLELFYWGNVICSNFFKNFFSLTSYKILQNALRYKAKKQNGPINDWISESWWKIS